MIFLTDGFGQGHITQTHQQFPAVLSIRAGIENDVDIWIWADIAFITKLPLAVILGGIKR